MKHASVVVGDLRRFGMTTSSPLYIVIATDGKQALCRFFNDKLLVVLWDMRYVSCDILVSRGDQ